jgi:hypothetical protein
MKVLNDPEKPAIWPIRGQQRFMVNFALAEAVAAVGGRHDDE